MVSNKPHLIIPWSKHPSLALNPAFGLSTRSNVAAFPPTLDRDHKSMISPSILTNRYARPSWSKSSSSSCASSNAEADVIAMDPLKASQSYRSKSLWTDFDVSSSSIRVAFRYVFDNAEIEINSVNDDDKSLRGSEADSEEETIHLCWINGKGEPCKFYKLQPCHKNIPRVDNDDHIESTFPGHAFVFCKRMDDVFTKIIVEVAKNDGGEKKGGVVVVHHDSLTVFLRRKSVGNEGRSDSDSNSGSDSDNEEGQNDHDRTRRDSGDVKYAVSDNAINDVGSGHENNGGDDLDDDNFVVVSKESSNFEGEWEAFLLVGGFRPGTASDDTIKNQEIGSAQADHDSAADDNSKQESENNLSNISDDSDDDEWTMRLVTTVQKKIANQHNIEDEDTKSHTSLRGATSAEHHDRFPRFLNHNQFSLTAQVTKLDPTPVNTADKHYDNLTLGGWPCRVEPNAFSSSCKLRSRIESDLRAASSRLPPHACQKLQLSTPIWINKSLSYGPKVAPIQDANMCFHPGKEWLVRNGMNPAKVGGVEMYRASSYLDDCDLWGPGGLILHELSHAWHCLHCEGGYDNTDIQTCYDQAMKEKLYDCVPYHCEKGKKEKRKAYACTNAMEYFAELSAAFLGGLHDDEYNKWFPFNRKQVREHDPRAFDMLCRMWGVIEVEGKV